MQRWQESRPFHFLPSPYLSLYVNVVDKFVMEDHFSDLLILALTAVAGFRTVVLKSKDGGEERNEEEEQSDKNGVLLSEVTE